jgi:hypothetical protein
MSSTRISARWAGRRTAGSSAAGGPRRIGKLRGVIEALEAAAAAGDPATEP